VFFFKEKFNLAQTKMKQSFSPTKKSEKRSNVTCEIIKKRTTCVVVVSERERERDKRERSDVEWSDDARAEKTDWSERCVEFDRERRRYLF